MSTLFQTLPEAMPLPGMMPEAEQSGFGFPAPLTEKYRPRRVADFIGLAKPRKVLSALLARPRSGSLIFVGPPGTGKTTSALAFAEELGAELHHVPSAEARIDRLTEVIAQCHRVAFNFKTGKPAHYHVVLCDEADAMSDATGKFLLSKMDSSAAPPNTIFIFTCNSTEKLEERFLSRCIKLEFSGYGSNEAVTRLLESIWDREAPKDAERPTFSRLACNNVRESLNRLDSELLCA